MTPAVIIDGLHVRAFTIPTDRPEADGTLSWDRTTIVLVEASGGGRTGIGYTYASEMIGGLITGKLAEVVTGGDALAPQAAWRAMQRAVRNLGRSGLAATAIAAVDTALYDLKARLLDVSLAALLGCYRDEVVIYGSGGFTSYTEADVEEQLAGWVERDGCSLVKMKVGSEPARDPSRVRAVSRALDDRATLFVDANGAYGVKQALRLSQRFAEQGVGWFEEPVSSDDLDGLRAIRERAPFGMEIAAGEYTYTLDDARTMLAAEAIDVMQADVTRCAGITGFLQIAALCEAHHIDLSGHCAPALHLHVACAAPRLRHLEWFHDHVRIERMLFEGAPVPRDGVIRPDLSRPGNGLAFKAQDAARYAA
ncbi:mandelate racemase [Rhodopseudomonas palustris]|uniref:Mandelate racemase n=1 Tax=Rhodopseudomonas palustris TaxID=1076 RepID=A0A323UJW9_RHOPL|nr:enolase C-terminal domain-like protein [Rhodopseudomonas palustris]PZA12497.1 mandelate racemase [Rhodopseudomonas palustris]